MMQMASIKVDMASRDAVFKLPFDKPSFGLKKDVVYNCRVLGLGPYQYTEGDCEACPYFIVEVAGGRCMYVDPDHIKFVDIDSQFTKEANPALWGDK